ncbi:MAG TPA: hypothetical protein DEB46_09475, partial [Myxococcales bacterium]|nr:hypothetical protein [Myxococcales bacterium]
MLVLHTLWSSRDYLALWVEDTEQRASVPETWQPGVVHNHPRALPLKGLKFPTRLFGAKGYKFNADQLVVEVPTAEGMPVAKGAVAPDSGEVRLMPWRVPVQVIRPEEALGTLLALASFPSKTGHERGAAFWSFAQLASLGTESIARGDVLPTVRIGDDDEPLRGEWRPFLGTDDVQSRLNAVLDRMSPSACTDFIPGLPLPATKSIAEKFLNTCVHGTCRQALTRHELLPRAGLVRGSHPAFPGWLTALAGASRPMPGSLPDTVTFEAQIEGWYRLAENRGRLFRTCLEIDPPRETMAVEDDEGYDVAREVAKENPWQLTIYLQADDDPDYKVSAERIWTNRRNAAFAKDMGIEDPPAVLRSGLDRIAEACPELAPALRKPRVATIALSTRNAHRFMKDSAPRLVELGMTVVLPPWWAQRHETVGLALVASGEDEQSEQEAPAASGAFMGKGPTGILDREALCRFQWQVALGDQRISPKELYRLAQMKQPLVQVGGKWVEIDADQMQTALRYFNKKGDEGDIGISEVMRQGLLEEKVPLPLVDLNLEGALARLAAENGSGMDEMDTPELFEGELRPYQKRGLSWLRFLGRLSMGACLADDMGLGKTVQLLALLENTHDDTWARVEADEKFVPASLLVCPMSVVGNWRREAEKFTPRVKVLVHHGSERLAGDEFLRATREHDLIITTYGLGLRDKDLLGQVDWRRIVLDEAQNIKNPSARQTQAIRTLKSNDRLALTGTPVENHLTELWSIMHFLNPGLLGSQRDYKNRFATPIERHGDKEASALLRRLTGPFILR